MSKVPAPNTRLRLAVATAVGFVAASLAVPMAAAHWWFTPDSIEQLAIANAWVNGAGFVDPIQWSYHQNAGPPLPGGSVRPPLVSLLLAIPLALGADLTSVFVLHALWASCVVGATVWVASGFMNLGVAAAFGLLLGASPGWFFVARSPLTEVTGCAALLAVLATAGGLLRSPSRALVCAGFTWLAWLARPNLGALVLAVAAAAAWELGPRAALRQRSCWAYVAGFAGLVLATQLAVSSATGSALYSGYDPASLGVRDATEYGREQLGTWPFLRENAGEIAATAAGRIESVGAGLFLAKGAQWHWLGWLAVIGVPWALLRRRDGIMAQRLSAFCALGFTLQVVLNYAGYEPRYLLLPVVCGGLCGAGLLDAGLRRGSAALSERSGQTLLPRWLPLLPAAAAALWVTLGPASDGTLRAWRLGDPEQRASLAAFLAGPPYESLCRLMQPDALVVARMPWQVSAACGNAALRQPTNLHEPGIAESFLEEKQPAYFVALDEQTSHWLGQRPELRALARFETLALYAVREPGMGSRPWRAPPPLACAGRGRACLERLRGPREAAP